MANPTPIRIEGRAKVTGSALYTGDFGEETLRPYLQPGEAGKPLIHAAVFQSGIAKGRVLSIDTEQAEKIAGVHMIVTHVNAPRLKKANSMMQSELARFLPLQNDAIHYRGQPLAILLAESPEAARNASSLITATYEESTAKLDFVENIASAKPLKKVGAGYKGHEERGHPEEDFSKAVKRIDRLYTTDAAHHNAMEPGSTIAHWHAPSAEPVRLTCICSTQFVFGEAILLGEAFDLGIRDGMLRLGLAIGLGAELDAKVRVVAPLIGGGFGSKGNNSHLLLAAMASKLCGHPVKLVLTRPQTFSMMPYRGAVHQRIRLGANAEGRISSLLHESVLQTAETGTFNEPTGEMTAHLYDVANVLIDHCAVRLDVNANGWMRAPGLAPAHFAIESAFDELADELHVDPIVLRLRNYAEKDPATGKEWSSKKLRECYVAGASAIGWHQRSAQPRSQIVGDEAIGYGMATSAYPTNQFPATVRITLHADGTARVQTCAHEIGQGALTTLATIAAEALQLSLEKVQIEIGDTTLPMAFMAGGSSTSLSVGEAILNAAKTLKKKLARPHTFPLRAKGIAGRTFGKSSFGRASFGAQFVRVAVQEATGKVRVTHMAGAFAAGRILNARAARSQYLGGMIMGLGHALMEQTSLDLTHGAWVNANLGEAHVPVNADIPEIAIHMIEEDDSRGSALGAKGIGELGIVGTAAAIANAIYNATGKRIRSLPITPDKLL